MTFRCTCSITTANVIIPSLLCSDLKYFQAVGLHSEVTLPLSAFRVYHSRFVTNIRKIPWWPPHQSIQLQKFAPHSLTCTRRQQYQSGPLADFTVSRFSFNNTHTLPIVWEASSDRNTFCQSTKKLEYKMSKLE